MFTFEVDANLRAVVLGGCAFVDIFADLWIVFGHDVASIAGADVSSTSQILTTMFASAIVGFGARAGQMAAAFVRFIFTVVVQVAQKFFGDAPAVGASELSVGVARLGTLSAQSDIVLVRAILAVVVTVANLPA